MAKITNGELVIMMADSVKGFYKQGMIGVVEDYRYNGNDEYLVRFPNRTKRVWVDGNNATVLKTLSEGDRVMAIVASPKGFYSTGQLGVVKDYRSIDGGEYLVEWDDRDKPVWSKKENLQKIGTLLACDNCGVCCDYDDDDDDWDDDDDDCDDRPKGILLNNKYEYLGMYCGEILPIVSDEFGYYVVEDSGYEERVEKQDLFVLEEGKDFYIHILDLRRLRELGCEFNSDSELMFDDEVFIQKGLLDVIDKSFKCNIDEDGEIYFSYKNNSYVVEPHFLSAGLMEFRR